MRGLFTRLFLVVVAVNAIGVTAELNPRTTQKHHSRSPHEAATDRIVASHQETQQDCTTDGHDACSKCHFGHCAFILPAPVSSTISLRITSVDSFEESIFLNRSIAPPSEPPKAA